MFQDSPTSDFDSNGDLDYSEPSTPSTPLEPFEPQYKVKVTEPVKDGEIVQYTVRTANVSILIFTTVYYKFVFFY